jgi:hypothetical protein
MEGSDRTRWHHLNVVRKVSSSVRREAGRFWLAVAPVVGLVGLISLVQWAASLHIKREGWAWILVIGLLSILVIVRIQERRALAAKDDEIAERNAELAERTRGGASAPLLAMNDTSQFLADASRDMAERARERAAARRQDRKEALAALHTEYLISGDDISPGLLAGTERPPENWMRRRVAELGWERLLPEYADANEEQGTWRPL